MSVTVVTKVTTKATIMITATSTVSKALHSNNYSKTILQGAPLLHTKRPQSGEAQFF